MLLCILVWMYGNWIYNWVGNFCYLTRLESKSEFSKTSPLYRLLMGSWLYLWDAVILDGSNFNPRNQEYLI